MNLLDLLNKIVEDLNALIRASSDQQQWQKLTKLRDVFDKMSDEAVQQLFDQNTDDYRSAISALQAASSDAQAGLKNVGKVASAINTAVTAANAADKVLGFLAHIA